MIKTAGAMKMIMVLDNADLFNRASFDALMIMKVVSVVTIVTV